jgi:hypothetical protein
MAVARRPALRDCLEHALGKHVARACAEILAAPGVDQAYPQRHLLRFADDAERVRHVMKFLYQRSDCLPALTGQQPGCLVDEEDTRTVTERPKTMTATNRGDIAATLVPMYRGGTNPELQRALAGYVQEEAARLPRFDGTLALILDASGSTQGYGEREYCCLSQSQALRLVLERCCRRFQVSQVGGRGDPLRPEGPTDLATPVLDALESGADVVGENQGEEPEWGAKHLLACKFKKFDCAGNGEARPLPGRLGGTICGLLTQTPTQRYYRSDHQDHLRATAMTTLHQ